jgi:hypothetical protein
MKSKDVCAIGVILFLTNCAAKVKKDYLITDVSSEKKPVWVKNGVYNPKNSEYKYFVSESENADRRLCLRSSSSRGTAKISSEIANIIENTYQEVIEDKNLKKENISSEKLIQTIKGYIAGVEQDGVYWEKRNYKKELGAKDDVEKYNCFTLLKMKNADYNKAVDTSLKRMYNEINASDEVKEGVKNKILQAE